MQIFESFSKLNSEFFRQKKTFFRQKKHIFIKKLIFALKVIFNTKKFGTKYVNILRVANINKNLSALRFDLGQCAYIMVYNLFSHFEYTFPDLVSVLSIS